MTSRSKLECGLDNYVLFCGCGGRACPLRCRLLLGHLVVERDRRDMTTVLPLLQPLHPMGSYQEDAVYLLATI
jgi:hypothetical protein